MSTLDRASISAGFFRGANSRFAKNKVDKTTGMEESKLHHWLVCLHLRVLDFEFYLFQYNAVMTAFKQFYDNRMILKPLASHNLAVKIAC